MFILLYILQEWDNHYRHRFHIQRLAAGGSDIQDEKKIAFTPIYSIRSFPLLNKQVMMVIAKSHPITALDRP